MHRARSNLSANEGEWINSDKLEVGDLVRTPTGEWKPILSINHIEAEAAVYNFEVEQNHDYFVGSLGVLVHNQTDCLDIAQAALERSGGGNILEVTPRGSARFVDKPTELYPTNTDGWTYHAVHVNERSMVYDPMSRFGTRRFPVQQWKEFWETPFNDIHFYEPK